MSDIGKAKMKRKFDEELDPRYVKMQDRKHTYICDKATEGYVLAAKITSSVPPKVSSNTLG